jgi:hypothetical protein
MKLTIFAAALMLSGTAFAQTESTSPSPGSSVQSSAPERDARGIPVVSDTATAPPGWNTPPGTGPVANASAPAQPQGSAGELPPCSRTVTDRCTQTYERGVRPRG